MWSLKEKHFELTGLEVVSVLSGGNKDLTGLPKGSRKHKTTLSPFEGSYCTSFWVQNSSHWQPVGVEDGHCLARSHLVKSGINGLSWNISVTSWPTSYVHVFWKAPHVDLTRVGLHPSQTISHHQRSRSKDSCLMVEPYLFFPVKDLRLLVKKGTLVYLVLEHS